MTEEQVTDLFLQLEHLHPANEAETLRDEEYEAAVARDEAATRDVLWNDTVVTPATPPVKAAAEWEPVDWER